MNETSVTDSGKENDAGILECKLQQPYTTKDQDCNACAEKECCEVINACLEEVDCNDGYALCVIGCALEEHDASAPDAGDPTKPCRDKCGKDYPVGKPLFEAFSKCTDEKCSSPCE